MENKNLKLKIACNIILFLLIIFPRIAMAQYGWQALNYSAGFYQSIYFSDTLNGWLVGYLTVGGNGILRYTSNGGQSWTDQASPTSPALNKIIFINQIGYCAGDSGVILKTTDAGVHWNLKKSNTEQNLKSIYFYNSQLGWACGGSTIVKTTDGGETWSAQQISGSSLLNDIAFGTAQFGYAADYWGNNAKTIDGGITWISASFSEPIGSYIGWNVVHFISPTNIILEGYSIVHSLDSGTTWDLCWNGNGSDQIQGITFADRINGWAAGGQKILRTSDGGKSWKAQLWSGSSNSLMTINCVDSNHAWAGGRDIMYSTSNAGETIIQTPLLLSPTNGVIDVLPNPTLSWTSVSYASSYHIEVATDSLFNNMIYNDSTIIFTYQVITNLILDTNYYWRVCATNGDTKSDWSFPWKFRTTNGVLHQVSPANGALNVPVSPQLLWNGIGATVFHLQLATDSSFNGTIVIDTIITNNNTFSIGPLPYKMRYYWRICTKDNDVLSKWTDPWSFTIRDKINAPFPMDVGDKWYYVYYSSYHPPNPYGIKKEIIDTTQNGFRTVQVTNYYSTSTTNSIEYLYNTDGKLYQTSSNSISDSDYPLYNAELQGDWGYFWLAFYHPFSTYFFNTSTDAQTMSSGANFLGGGFNESYTTTIKFGVIRHSYYANQASTIIDNDSTLLVGMMKNGIIFGDTTLVDYRARTPALSLPPNGYIDIPRTFVFSWNKASEVGSYRLQISKDPQFQTLYIDDSTLTGTSRVVNGLEYYTQYYWHVLSITTDGHQYWSQVWSFITTPDPRRVPNLLSPPNGIFDLPQTIAFYWNRAFDTKSYKFEIYTDSTLRFNYKVILNVDTSIVIDGLVVPNVYIDGVLAESQQYFWRVVTSGNDGLAYYSRVWSFTIVNNSALFPNLVSPSNALINVPNMFIFCWNKAGGAGSYRLQISKDSLFQTIFIDDSTLTDTSKVVNGLQYKTQYYWRIESDATDGHRYWSKIGSFTTLDPSSVPTEYKLFQNYPNPFNPSTKISYAIAEISNVRIVVYDILGREVRTLINEKHQPGYYEVDFNSSGLASGVYIYRIQAGNFVETKKLVLLK